VILCIIFSIASAYSGLKVGQGMEAAIPISILAIGLGGAYTSGAPRCLKMSSSPASAQPPAAWWLAPIFTLPALYILHLDPHPVQTIFICLAGGCMGVLFLIPLRRYFTREMHGQLPFPEATAITEVLVTGEKGGSQAQAAPSGNGIAAAYDFFVTTFHVWKEYLDFQFVPVMRSLADKGRHGFQIRCRHFHPRAWGYVMGLRSAMVFCAGSVLTSFVLVPLIWYFGSHINTAVYPSAIPIAQMTAAEIVRQLRCASSAWEPSLRPESSASSNRCAWSRARSASPLAHLPPTAKLLPRSRTDRDISIISILLGVVVSSIAVAIFFGRLQVSWTVLALGLVLTLIFSFFFTSVAANAIATTANNPASGMTMLTIIISAVVLLNFGLSGDTGNVFRDGYRRNGMHRLVRSPASSSPT